MRGPTSLARPLRNLQADGQEDRMAVTAQDIMTTDLMTVTPSTSLTQFARICVEDNISGCPVIGVDGRTEGIVSKTDLLERLLEGSHNYSANPDHRPPHHRRDGRQGCRHHHVARLHRPSGGRTRLGPHTTAAHPQHICCMRNLAWRHLDQATEQMPPRTPSCSDD